VLIFIKNPFWSPFLLAGWEKRKAAYMQVLPRLGAVLLRTAKLRPIIAYISGFGILRRD
jgi:hypothetical protein